MNQNENQGHTGYMAMAITRAQSANVSNYITDIIFSVGTRLAYKTSPYLVVLCLPSFPRMKKAEIHSQKYVFTLIYSISTSIYRFHGNESRNEQIYQFIDSK